MTNGIKYLMLLMGCYLVIQPLQAQNIEEVSMTEAIEQALNNSYAYQIAQKNIEIANRNNNYGEAGRYPSVSLNINSQNTYSDINNPTSFLNGAQLLNVGATGSLDVNWVLFDGYKVRINKQRLDVLEEQSIGNSKIAVENVTQQVIKAYFNAMIQRKRLEMQAEVLDLSRDKIDYVEVRREYGQATEFDRLQINNAYLNDSIQWAVQNGNYEVALLNLGLAMGMEDTRVIPSDSLDYLLPDYDLATLQESLIQNNQQLRNSKIQEQLAQIDIDFNKSNLYPRLTLGTSISEQLSLARVSNLPQIPNDFQGGSTFAAGVNLSLSYNLYNGGRVTRSIANAETNKRISELNTKDLERSLSYQLDILWTRYQQQKELYALTEQLYNNALANLLIAEEYFDANTLNFFDFRTIQINYIQSLNALQDAFLNAKNTEVDMLLFTGALISSQ